MSPQKTPSPRKKPSSALITREAPEEHIIAAKEFIQPIISQQQIAAMIGRPPEWAIKHRPGGGGRSLSYVPHGWVNEQLNKMFGFDWDIVLTPMANGQMYALQIESIVPPPNARDKTVREVRHVAVSGYIEARVRNSKKEIIGSIKKSGFGSQLWLPTMEFGDALKAATSDLLKVCAAKFGVALTLYYDDEAERAEYEAKQQSDIIEGMVIEQGPPTNVAVLIARAQSELGMDFKTVQEVLKLDMQTISAGLPEGAQNMWNALKEAKNGK